MNTVKLLFDGMILNDNVLQEVTVKASQTPNKFDVVARDGDDTHILKTLDTEKAAETWLKTLGDKLVAEDSIDVIDVRGTG